MTYEDQVAKARERFQRDTAEHAITVLRDDELYRHLRFQKPGTGIYGFDLVTWPGYLAIVGDCGDYLFSRTTDMLEFFEPSGARGGFEDVRWGINPEYWSEKLQAPRHDAVRVYSYELFKAQVLEWFESELCGGLAPREQSALRKALDEQVLNDWLGATHDEHEAYRLLRDFEHAGHRIDDASEWDFREFDGRFLWCCWAIVWGIGQYRAATPAEQVAA